MKFRTTALALLALSSTSLAACSSAQERTTPRPAPSTTAPCAVLLPSSDNDLDGNAWAEAVASHGTLDYVGTRFGYGMVVTMDGTPIGYALAEDSTVYTTSECALSNGPGYAS